MTTVTRKQTCPKCSSEMEVGFLLDHANVNRLPTLWIKDPPERTFWTLAKLKGKTKKRVDSFRCTRCGFIELYAQSDWTGWPKR